LRIYGLTGCAGDQLVILNCEDELLDIAGALDIRSFPMAMSGGDDKCPLDIVFVNGSVVQPQDEQVLKSLRRRSKLLVAIGTCAVWGGVTKGKLAYTIEEYRQYVEEDLKLIEELSPDLIISDWRISIPVCRDITGIPTIMIANAHWSPYSIQPLAALDSPLVRISGYKGTRAIMMLFKNKIAKYYVRPYNTVRKSYGLRLLNSLQEICDCIDRCPHWLLYLDIPSLSPTADIPSNHSYLGPPIWSPYVVLPDWWDDLPPDKPVVYLTLRSSGNLKHMPMIMKMLANKSVTVLFASGGRYQSESIPDNFYVTDYLPGVEACRKAAFVICNGGKGAIYQALSVGKPVLGVSTNWDQYMSMQPLEKQGAGILIRSMQINKKRISKAPDALLKLGTYQESAQKLQKEMDQYCAQERFRGFIDSLWEGKNEEI
jgi:UDP:flavonoid glycosyltransferase YjiC (YdhE family)